MASGTPGRPRSRTVDEAILRAAGELLREEGVDGTTINAVARRSGVARASIYLRYPNRDALLMATIRSAIGRDPIAVTGDLERDLHRAAEQARAVFSSPPFRQVFPRLVAGLLEKRKPRPVTYDMLAPSRQLGVEEYRQLAPAANLRTDVDPELVLDMLIGGLLNRMLATGGPPSARDAAQVVDILLEGLRRKPGRQRR